MAVDISKFLTNLGDIASAITSMASSLSSYISPLVTLATAIVTLASKGGEAFEQLVSLWDKIMEALTTLIKDVSADLGGAGDSFQTTLSSLNELFDEAMAVVYAQGLMTDSHYEQIKAEYTSSYQELLTLAKEKFGYEEASE